jgi:hypothetical protein
LTIENGNASAPKITFVVDRTTRGPAEIIAVALSSHGRAVLSGSLTGGDLSIRQVVSLPDGSGYELVTGDYTAVAETHSGRTAMLANEDEVAATKLHGRALHTDLIAGSVGAR